LSQGQKKPESYSLYDARPALILQSKKHVYQHGVVSCFGGCILPDFFSQFQYADTMGYLKGALGALFDNQHGQPVFLSFSDCLIAEVDDFRHQAQ